ncbi:hypothetical protein EVA_22221 [gut metagenome]|uniref:Uncharacterized protein n=1 Tax=gut metagenome TaxID=749906 RepID=J9FQN4_9ZZZZ
MTSVFPRGKKKLAISMASSNNPPPLLRKSMMSEVIPCFFKSRKACLNSLDGFPENVLRLM